MSAKARFSPESEDRPGGRTAVRISSAVAVIALAAIVAIASRWPLSGSGAATATVAGAGPKIPPAWVIALVIATGAIVLVEVILVVRSRTVRAFAPRGLGRRLLQVAVLALLLGGALRLLSHPRKPPRVGPATSHQLIGAHATLRHVAPSSVPVWLGLGLITALVVINAVILAILLAPQRRRRAGIGASADAARSAIEASLAALEEEGDPRLAVIAAYRRMEIALAAAGLPRTASESPREYLARTLGSLELSAAPMRTLTRLFERARFSLRRIAPGDRDAAIEALQSLRDELGTEELHAVRA